MFHNKIIIFVMSMYNLNAETGDYAVSFEYSYSMFQILYFCQRIKKNE